MCGQFKMVIKTRLGALRYNNKMDKIFEGVARIDAKAKCPKCKKPITRKRGLGTLTEVCIHCGYTNVEGRK